MTATNKIHGIHWTLAFGLPFAILIALVVSAFGELPSVPSPVIGGEMILDSSGEYEWELTFEYSTDVTFTNITTTYPIMVSVPFEHDSGFVRVVANKRLISAEVGRPTEHLVVPITTNMQIVVWDYFSDDWVTNRYSGSAYDFFVPAWNRWYWLSIEEGGEVVWDKWIGHFKTD